MVRIHGRDVWPFWAGLPGIGRRPLRDEERRAIQGRARGLNAGGCALGCLLPVLFIATVVVLVEIPDGETIWLAAALLLFAGIACAGLWANTLCRRAIVLRRDADAGFVEIYPVSEHPHPAVSGPLPRVDAPLPTPDPVPRLPAQRHPAPNPAPVLSPPAAGLPAAGPAAQTRRGEADAGSALLGHASYVEVLPESRIAWRWNGKPVVGWVEFPRVETGRAPVEDQDGGWIESARDERGWEVAVSDRALSPAECRELRQRRHRLVRSALIWAVPINLWAGSPIALALLFGEWPTLDAPWLGLLVLAAFCNLLVAGDGWHAWLLTQEMRAGRVIVARYPPAPRPPAPEEGANLPAPVTDDEPALVEEYLPVSRRLWSRGGRPAEWRLTTKAEE